MKVDSKFKHDIYRFIHLPIREEDKKSGSLFLERYIYGMQKQFENAFSKIDTILDLYNPAKTPQPKYLKDIVGLTKELDNIVSDISDSDLRKLISLAVPLWKEKGLDVGYKDIIRLFTGKNCRIFNWFDFRYIVGEQGLAQEELGEDSWFISKIGVEGSVPSGNVVSLLPFENNFKDRSLYGNNAIIHGDYDFFSPGVVLNSDNYLWLFNTGILEIPNSSKFDFSSNFTIEGFIKSSKEQDGVLWSKQSGSKKIEIIFNSILNQIDYSLSDGVITLSETLSVSEDLSDGVFRHFALVVSRTSNLAKIFFNGEELSSGIDISGLGDLTNLGKIWIGGRGPGDQLLECGLDEWRISLSEQYLVSLSEIVIPAVEFVQYQEEQLDEFYCDIRVVDEGDLNRTLTKRILNLMRPMSERLRVIYIRFFEDFEYGKGGLRTDILGSYVDLISKELVLPSLALEVCDTADSENFQDMVIQVRSKIESGNSSSIRFLVQDINNYYEFKMRSDNLTFELSKVVGGMRTLLCPVISAQIYNNTFYVLSITTDYKESTGEVLINCYQDRNVIFNIFDNQFSKGTWGVQSGENSQTRISAIEMFLMPLDVDIIKPNAIL